MVQALAVKEISQMSVMLLFHQDLIVFLRLIDPVWMKLEPLNSRNNVNITRQKDCTCTARYCSSGQFECCRYTREVRFHFGSTFKQKLTSIEFGPKRKTQIQPCFVFLDLHVFLTLHMPCGGSRALCRIISGLHFCMGGFGEGWQCLCLLVELYTR